MAEIEESREWEADSPPKWPEAAVVKAIGYIPTIDEIFAVYGWRMDAHAPPQSSPEAGTEQLRRDMQEMFFPLPVDVETDHELKSLIAKVVVGDGLWSSFVPGKPFNEYFYDYTPPVSNDVQKMRVYSDEQAKQLGEMFAKALEVHGPAKLWETCLELAHVMIMPR